jgi:hypothetical protein
MATLAQAPQVSRPPAIVATLPAEDHPPQQFSGGAGLPYERKSAHPKDSGRSGLTDSPTVIARGRVKKTIATNHLEIYFVVQAVALQRLRILYLKSNRIALFRQRTDVSHGVAPLQPHPEAVTHAQCFRHPDIPCFLYVQGLRWS